MDHSGDITVLLRELAEAPDEAGRRRVVERLLPRVYRELKMLAKAQRVRWEGPRTPGTTSLVHDAWIRLAASDGSDFPTRGHFYALASRVMRSVLVDNARHFSRAKRGDGVEPLLLPWRDAPARYGYVPGKPGIGPKE